MTPAGAFTCALCLDTGAAPMPHGDLATETCSCAAGDALHARRMGRTAFAVGLPEAPGQPVVTWTRRPGWVRRALGAMRRRRP